FADEPRQTFPQWTIADNVVAQGGDALAQFSDGANYIFMALDLNQPGDGQEPYRLARVESSLPKRKLVWTQADWEEAEFVGRATQVLYPLARELAVDRDEVRDRKQFSIHAVAFLAWEGGKVVAM